MAGLDAAMIANEARLALDEHPGTWTSYAQLCDANGLSRRLALVVARLLVPEPTESHWYRIRNEAGVYRVPADEPDRGDPSRYSQSRADQLLGSIGVGVVNGRADPARKLVWGAQGWALADQPGERSRVYPQWVSPSRRSRA
jgi:hypothetical protein